MEERVAAYTEQACFEQDVDKVAVIGVRAVTDDGIVDPRDTRTVLAMCLSVVRNTEVKGAEGYGVFRL